MKGKLDIDELEKLRDESIITEEQFQEICSRLQNSKDKNRDLLVNVLIGIGIFLVALGIISLFAYNWDNIPNIARVLIGLIPTFISIGLLYKYMDKKQTFYNVMVNVFSPFAFIATNAIISQTYHTQSTVFKIVIISLIMYIPIFILTKKNKREETKNEQEQ
jgi:uncharacterized membrane protein